MSVTEEGLKGALRLKAIDLARMEKRATTAEWELAALRMEMASMKVVLSDWASRAGKDAFGMNAPSLERWLNNGEPK